MSFKFTSEREIAFPEGNGFAMKKTQSVANDSFILKCELGTK